MSQHIYQCKRCNKLFDSGKTKKMYSRNIPFNVCPFCKSTEITFIKMYDDTEAYLSKFLYNNLKV